ncbi:MAG: hypothetical protein O3C10_05920 [Chloroflexi bacterium]|nr:hypothetical protein [Chloroflexota bacterium]
MSKYAANYIHASEVLSALGALAVAQEEDRLLSEIDSLTGDVLDALDDFWESRGDLAA